MLIPLIFPGPARAQNISPASEQEFADAKVVMESAQRAQAEKYAPAPFQKAQDLLQAAEKAWQTKDLLKFTQASRLARIYADLAKVTAELKSEEEKIFTLREELEKARGEIELLKKSR